MLRAPDRGGCDILIDAGLEGNVVLFEKGASTVQGRIEASGARWEDLVDVTVYLTDMARDFAAYNRVYAEHFTTAQPCRTTLGITALPTPIAIELKCVAALTEGR